MLLACIFCQNEMQENDSFVDLPKKETKITNYNVSTFGNLPFIRVYNVQQKT